MFPIMPVYLDQDRFPCNEILLLLSPEQQVMAPWVVLMMSASPEIQNQQEPVLQDLEFAMLSKSQTCKIQPKKDEVRHSGGR